MASFEDTLQTVIDKHYQVIKEHEERVKELTVSHEEEINLYKKRERQYITAVTRAKAKIALKSKETQRLRELLKQYNIEVPPLEELVPTNSLVPNRDNSPNSTATTTPTCSAEKLEVTPCTTPTSSNSQSPNKQLSLSLSKRKHFKKNASPVQPEVDQSLLDRSTSSDMGVASAEDKEHVTSEEEEEEVMIVETRNDSINSKVKDTRPNIITDETTIVEDHGGSYSSLPDQSQESVALFESHYHFGANDSEDDESVRSPSLLRSLPEIAMAMEMGKQSPPLHQDALKASPQRSHDQRSRDTSHSSSKRSRKSVPKQYPPKRHKRFDQTTLTQYNNLKSDPVSHQLPNAGVVPPTPLIRPTTSSKWQNELITVKTDDVIITSSSKESTDHLKCDSESNVTNKNEVKDSTRNEENLLAKKAGLPSYKFIAHFKKKDDRAKLKASACPECQKWFKSSSGNINMEHLQQTCRHKHLYQPPLTDPSIWNIGFPDTAES